MDYLKRRKMLVDQFGNKKSKQILKQRESARIETSNVIGGKSMEALLKIKGERKLKHAFELIEKLCAEQNALPPVKDYETVDYTIAEQTTDELVQAGLVRQFTAAVPVGAFETGVVLGE